MLRAGTRRSGRDQDDSLAEKKADFGASARPVGHRRDKRGVVVYSPLEGLGIKWDDAGGDSIVAPSSAHNGGSALVGTVGRDHAFIVGILDEQ